MPGAACHRSESSLIVSRQYKFHIKHACTAFEQRLTFWARLEAKVGTIEVTPDKGADSGLELACRYVRQLHSLKLNAAGLQRCCYDDSSKGPMHLCNHNKLTSGSPGSHYVCLVRSPIL